MMDLLMISVLIISFLSMVLFVNWVDKQIKKQRRRTYMWLLVLIIIALAGYLVYALINPEKFQ